MKKLLTLMFASCCVIIRAQAEVSKKPTGKSVSVEVTQGIEKAKKNPPSQRYEEGKKN